MLKLYENFRILYFQKRTICGNDNQCPVLFTANTLNGNYYFLNLEIVENSNGCRKFQFFNLIY